MKKTYFIVSGSTIPSVRLFPFNIEEKARMLFEKKVLQLFGLSRGKTRENERQMLAGFRVLSILNKAGKC